MEPGYRKAGSGIIEFSYDYFIIWAFDFQYGIGRGRFVNVPFGLVSVLEYRFLINRNQKFFPVGSREFAYLQDRRGPPKKKVLQSVRKYDMISF